MSNFEPLLVSDALLEQAEQMCRSRLAKDPDNPALIESLAKLARKRGGLDEAAGLYARLMALDPGNQEAAYAHAILAGTEIPEPPAGIQPAPFVLLKNFLPAAFHESLLPFVLANQEKLTPALVGNDEYKPDARESLELRGQTEIQRRFDGHIRPLIPAMASRFGVEPFQIGRLEVKLRAYLDGHFFRIHMDNPAGSGNENRRVSYVYFYHKVPRAYTGGDLLMFDTDTKNNLFTMSNFTLVRPEDNSLIIFPSACYHSVVPVKCPSKAFEDSRFVINGHVSRPAPRAPKVEAVAETVTTVVP